MTAVRKVKNLNELEEWYNSMVRAYNIHYNNGRYNLLPNLADTINEISEFIETLEVLNIVTARYSKSGGPYNILKLHILIGRDSK